MRVLAILLLSSAAIGCHRGPNEGATPDAAIATGRLTTAPPTPPSSSAAPPATGELAQLARAQPEGAPSDSADADGGTLGPLIWRGHSAGVEVEWTDTNITLRGDGGSSVDLFPQPRRNPDCEGEATYRLLSVVGTVVSYEEFVGEDCSGAAHGSAVTRYAAIDAIHPKRRVLLTALFDPADVLRALLADPIVRRHVARADPPTTTAKLVESLTHAETGCEYAFVPDFLSRFAFHHVESGKVAVRIALPHGCEANRGALTQLGIWLPVPQALAPALERASTRSQGFLMKDAERVSRGRQTRLKF